MSIDTPEAMKPYEALSYTWGDPIKCCEIICNSQRIFITKSLFEALQVLRPLQDSDNRFLWADSLCINQEDQREKTNQVKIMASIYKSATATLIWLGQEDSEKVKAGLDLVCQIASKGWNEAITVDYNKARGVARTFDNSTYQLRGEPCSPPTTRHASHALHDPPQLDALFPLFSCPWFMRTWILQEVVLSRIAILYWGLGSIDFDLVGLAATFGLNQRNRFTHMHLGGVRGAGHCVIMHDLWLKAYVDESMLTMLLLTRHHQASDPRDKVFGLLGLTFLDSNPDGSLFIEPDYALSKEELYTAIATKVLIDDEDTDFLAAIQHGPELAHDWPSWVPDWSQGYTSMLVHADRKTCLDTSATICKPACASCAQISVNARSVSVRGIIADTIRNLTANVVGDSLKWPSPVTPRTVQKLLIELQRSHSEEELAFTLSAGYGGQDLQLLEITPTTIAAHVAGYRAFLSWDLEHYIKTNSTIQPPTSDDSIGVKASHRFYTDIQSTIVRRRFFETSDGHLGLGPLAMREGDFVAVLFEGVVPYVLRPYGDGQHFRLVGEAYVHAIMNGQAIQKWRESGSPATDFHLY